MADGSLIFKTKIDTSGAEAGLAKLQANLARTTDNVKQSAAAVQQLESELRGLQNEAAARKASGAVEGEELSKRIYDTTTNLDTARVRLQQCEAAAAQAGAKLDEAMNPEKPALFAKATKTVNKQMGMLKTMFNKMMIRAAFLTAAFKGITAAKDYFSEAFKQNPEYVKAVGQLKAALMTLAQPVIEYVLPAFTKLIQILSIMITSVAKFFAMLSGKSLQAQAQSAENLYKESDAIKSVGASAKKSAGSLASFDEINTLSTDTGSSGGSSGNDLIKPNFDALDNADEKLKGIAELVAAIGAGLLLWKFSGMFTNGLVAQTKLFAGLSLAIAGCVAYIQNFKDAWENGVNWATLLKDVAASALAVGGLGLAFGKTGSAVGLIVTGLANLVLGLHDVMENGANLQNTLLIITGIVSAGLGISLLTGSFIPALIAGVASVIYALAAGTGHAKELLQGVNDFLSGVFTGDWKKAWQGLKEIGVAVWDSIRDGAKALWDKITEKAATAANWMQTHVWTPLDKKTSSFVGGVKDTFRGLLDSLISGIKGFFDWAINGIKGLASKINSFGLNFTTAFSGNYIGKGIANIGHIPELASGAVIPPNREFMAVLGDQKQGTNIEAPLDTIVAAFQKAQSNQKTVIEFGGTWGQLIRAMNPQVKQEQIRSGTSLIE